MTAIELRDVTKRYETGGHIVEALAGVDLAVETGEFLSIIGPSGSGKSTMLNLLGLLDAPTEGEVWLDGTDATRFSDAEATAARREHIGFVFQDFYLIPTLTALENVTVPTVFTPEGPARDRAAALLENVGLGDRLHHAPNELSGGQKQRVAIARSLINEPQVVLADEPTGNLDREIGERILETLREVTGRGVTVIAVTHDEQVNEYADRVFALLDGVEQ